MLRISMAGSEWSNMLDSLHKVASGDEEIPMDLNLIAEPDNTVKLYVRNYDTLQVIHELENAGNVNIEVSEPSNFVFDSKILRSVIQKAKDREVELVFDEHTFEVQIRSDSFTGPTQFELRLVQKSEFQDPIQVSGFKKIDDLDRVEFHDNLRMLSSVSKVAQFSVDGDTFEISVSDKVQGSGRVTENIEDTAEISTISAKYPIRPIQDFLKKMDTDQVSVHMTEGETLKIASMRPGMTSSLLRAERL